MRPRSVPTGAFWYTPKEDEGAERPTRFKLAPLTFDERMEAMDNATVTVHRDGETETRQRTFRQALEQVRSHLLEAEHFVPQPYPVDGSREAQDAWLAQIGEAGVFELSQALWNRSALTEAEKNGPSS